MSSPHLLFVRFINQEYICMFHKLHLGLCINKVISLENDVFSPFIYSHYMYVYIMPDAVDEPSHIYTLYKRISNFNHEKKRHIEKKETKRKTPEQIIIMVIITNYSHMRQMWVFTNVQIQNRMHPCPGTLAKRDYYYWRLRVLLGPLNLA